MSQLNEHEKIINNFHELVIVLINFANEKKISDLLVVNIYYR